jgi:hypothetical protein
MEPYLYCPVYLTGMHTISCAFAIVKRENGMTNMKNVRVGKKYRLKGKIFECKKIDTPGDQIKI